MITLELYSYIGLPSHRNDLYIAYFRTDDELQDMLTRLLAAAPFNGKQGHYILQATGTGGKAYYYTDHPTVEMHNILSAYKKVFLKAYWLARERMWPVAWSLSGEGYRITCALMQMDKARELLATEKWSI